MSAASVFHSARALASAARANTWCPHLPSPKQQEFLKLDCREALYGGAAGGGKSDALLMAALKYADTPGYNAILFRRTFADLLLPEALMDRSDTWLRGTKAHWESQERRWVFPSGATLSFGYLDSDSDKYRYQSAAFQYIGFDELTQFPERWYLYLISRLRRLESVDVELRMRGATNPGGIGHQWVKERFIVPGRSGCAFVPAKLEDNPHIDRAAYLEVLEELDSVTKRQLRDGDWNADASGLVYRYSRRLNAIGELPPGDWRYALGLDFGIQDENAVTVLAWKPFDPCTYIVESYRFKGEPSSFAKEIERLCDTYRFAKIIGDTGGLGKAFAEEMRLRWSIPVEPAEKHNKLGFIRLMNGALEQGGIKIVESGCAQLTDEWLSLPLANDGQREAQGFKNHCADSALYIWRWSRSYAAISEPQKVKLGTTEHEAELEKRLEREVEMESRPQRRSRKWLRSVGT